MSTAFALPVPAETNGKSDFLKTNNNQSYKKNES
jgi:hypothetical protein